MKLEQPSRRSSTFWIGVRPLGGIFDLPAKQERLEEVVRLLEQPEVWEDQKQSQALNKERIKLDALISSLHTIQSGVTDAGDLIEMVAEEQDQETLNSIIEDLKAFDSQLGELEFQRMFSGELDKSNAFIDLQSGSGGTEAQDWANMLLRMYLKWTSHHGFKTEILELSEGEVAGIKGATLKVSGDYAYGYLRTESGIHRLVRKSPFDSGNRRHTSFASVYIYPEVDDSIEIDLNMADVRIDTYRSSGAGGQHVNKTDSAVRLTHAPSGIVVQCQNDRSQHRNKEEAINMLKARLYEKELQERRDQARSNENSKADIGWGQQIRSYVLDQSRVKDLRTGVETAATQAVLDGDLDQFIEASLKAGI